MDTNKKLLLFCFIILVTINLGLFFWLSPQDSFFIEDVNDSYLGFAKYSEEFSLSKDFLDLYFWIGYRSWGMNPFFYHLINTIVHIFNVLLVYLLATKLTKKNWLGLISALLFSVHYMNTAVLFITKGINELLAASFVLLSLLTFIKFISLRRKRYYIFSLILFWIALIFNLSAAIFLLLIFIYIILYSSKKGLTPRIKQGIYMILPFWIILGVLLLGVIDLPYLPNLSIFAKNISDPITQKVYCFVNNFPDKILCIPTFFKFMFVPFDFQLLSTNFYQTNKAHSQLASAIILLFLLYLFFIIKKARYKFMISWLFLTPIPFLFQRYPCEGYAVKEKYLYIPLIGGCILMSFLIEEVGKRLKARWGNIKGGWQLYLTLLLIIPLTFSWHKRSYYREQIGNITKQGQNMVREVIFLSSQPKLIYMFLPNEIFRYQAFSGSGNLVGAVLPLHWEESLNIRFYTIELPSQLRSISERAYIYLGVVNEKFKEDIPVDLDKEPSERIKRGMDSLFPSYYDRYIFHYYNTPYSGIEEITDYVYPETEVIFEVFVSQPVEGLYISGDFNGWRKTPLALREGLWRVTLFLKPGLYRYYFVTEQGQEFVFSSQELQASSSKGMVSLLPVANYGLPVEFSSLKGTEYYNKAIECKEKIWLDPRNSGLHRKLANLYKKMGFEKAAFWEWFEADVLESAKDEK